MLLLALKMLIGDKTKFFSLILGLTFASFIITQQAAIMTGIVKRTFGFLTDIPQPNVWVTDPTVQYIDDIKPLKDTDLYKVLSVDGVDWAVPIYKGTIQVRLRDGTFQTSIIVGIDDATLIGGPPVMLQGKLIDLRQDSAVIVDKVGSETKLAHHVNGRTIPLQIGDTMELNDNHAVVVGIAALSRTVQSQPVIYTTYERATLFVPAQRKLLSFIIAHTKPGVDPTELAQRITAQTGLKAHTQTDMKLLTLIYYMKYTGIFVNFGVAILLGFIIGIAIAGQTLYNITIDNLRFFAIFKAMGAYNAMLIKMVLLQALYATLIGWGIGMGFTALFGVLAAGTELSFSLPFWLYALSLISILLISLLAARFCIRKVITVDPALVFKG